LTGAPSFEIRLDSLNNKLKDSLWNNLSYYQQQKKWILAAASRTN
jgi:hypothetical protein